MVSAMTNILQALMPAVIAALDSFQPDILFYVGGADPYSEDQLGGLSLSLEGLAAREGLCLKRREGGRSLSLRRWREATRGKWKTRCRFT